ncbi:MAG: diguanylate cyclase [Betaproteobacteria bacterium]|nr:diguanylate cyclase [Betaproteobacteria bacterium]
MRTWWSKLSLTNKLQLPIQLILLGVLLLIHFAALDKYTEMILDGERKEALISADGVLNGLNMLMLNRAISDPDQRTLYIQKMGASDGLTELRVMRNKPIQDEFGPGLPSEQPMDDMDQLVLKSGHLQSGLLQQAGRRAFRVVVPFIAKRDFRGTDCLTCHTVQEGTVLGAVSLTFDLSEEFSVISRAGYVLWGVQLILQALLYILVGRLIAIILAKDLQLLELDRIASTDKLTGAWNRRRLEEAVIGEMDRLRRYNHPLSLLIIDIDYFKKINDSCGHSVGDQVLAAMSAVVRSTLRVTDSLTRWGGEEFVVLCPNTTLSTEATLAERLREKISKTDFPVVGNISVSIGVAECLVQETWEQWFQRADAALYRAKASGRNQVQVAPETSHPVAAGESLSTHFVQLVWHHAYECGNKVIDDQHRALFGHANSLLAAVLSGRPAEEVAALIDALIHSVGQHFQAEEAIIAAAGFPGAVDHARIHHKLVETAGNLVADFHSKTLDIGDLFQFLANDLVAQHVLGADRSFFPYLQTRQ